MAETLTILTSPAVYAELVNGLPAQDRAAIAADDQLRVDHLRFIRARLGDGSGHMGESPGTDRSVPIYLGDDLSHIIAYTDKDWRTLWYNPDSSLAPQPIPAHDGEIVSLADLGAIPGLLAKPTLTTCLAWMDDWGLPDNIHRHVQLVARLAYSLGVMLRGHGEPVDPILAHRGGLLHDLDKLHTLDSDQRHGTTAANFLRTQGHPDLAHIVRGHILQSALEGHLDQQPWEVRLVFFCDKLVEQDQIVPFDERVDALKSRYPAFREVMERAEPTVWGLNDEICSILSISSHQNLILRLKELQNY